MKKVKVLLGALTVLAVEYLVIRYWLIALHNTFDVPFFLFVLCGSVVCIGALRGKNKLTICSVAGYGLSYILGLISNVEWIDPHGTACDSFGIVFTLAVLFCLIAGTVWEHIDRVKKGKG